MTSLLYLVPPCTALMAWVLFGESLTLLMMAGMALTVIGVALVVRPARTTRRLSAPALHRARRAVKHLLHER